LSKATRVEAFFSTPCRSTLRNSFAVNEEAMMGDRGGKKAKEKNQQQHIDKRKEKQQRKDDKAAPRAPLPASH
jgi:hypothetical protein